MSDIPGIREFEKSPEELNRDLAAARLKMAVKNCEAAKAKAAYAAMQITLDIKTPEFLTPLER